MGPRWGSMFERARQEKWAREDLSNVGVPKDELDSASSALARLSHSSREQIIEAIKEGKIGANVKSIRRKIKRMEAQEGN